MPRHPQTEAAKWEIAEYYREVLGEPIDLWPLVVQMLRTFMDSDRAFRAWRRQHRSGPAARVDRIRSDGE